MDSSPISDWLSSGPERVSAQNLCRRSLSSGTSGSACTIVLSECCPVGNGEDTGLTTVLSSGIGAMGDAVDAAGVSQCDVEAAESREKRSVRVANIFIVVWSCGNAANMSSVISDCAH